MAPVVQQRICFACAKMNTFLRFCETLLCYESCTNMCCEFNKAHSIANDVFIQLNQFMLHIFISIFAFGYSIFTLVLLKCIQINCLLEINSRKENIYDSWSKHIISETYNVKSQSQIWERALTLTCWKGFLQDG